MATELDLTAATAALKQRFAPDAMKLLVYQKNPFFAALKKQENMGGTNLKVPVRLGINQGQSSVFSTAQTNAYAPNFKAFEITRDSYYTVAQISGETVASTKGDLNAFVDLVALELSDSLLSHTDDLAGQLFRDGTGSIGAISNAMGATTGVITLTEPDDVTQFEVGQVLQARTGTASPHAALGYVISVNRPAGTITVSAVGQGGAAGDPSGWLQNDLLLIQGTNNLVIDGLAAWLPTTAPGSSDNFFGVNRSQDRSRLAGVVYDGTGMTIQQALINGFALGSREGAEPDMGFCSYDTFAALVNELGSKVQYTNPQATTLGGIPFKGLELYANHGTIKIMPDRSCQSGVVYGLTMSSWALASAGGAPMVDEFGQGMWLRQSSADGYELRVKSYAQLYCNAPGHNVKVLVTV